MKAMHHRPLAPEGRPAGADPAGARARSYVLAATIVGSAMAFIDGSVVTIALPRIGRDLGADFQTLQWVVNGYTLMLGALLLVGGGLGDRIGRRRVYLAGLILFALASLACAAAPTAGVLVAGRVVQGIGAAALVPQGLAIIAAAFPKAVRGKAIGTWAAASAVTTSLGPPVGGFLIDSLSWRAAFWINIPLAVAALWLTLRHVPESRDKGEEGRVDWAGSVLAVAALGALALGLTQLSEPEAGMLMPVSLLVAGLVGIGLFAAWERRAENPIMPPQLLRVPTFAIANLVTLLLYGSFSGALFLLPFDLIGRRGLSAGAVGLTLLPLGLVIGLLSRRMGAVADKRGPRPFLVAGSLLVGAGCAILALGLENYWLGTLLPILVAAFGMASVVSPLTTAVMNSIDDAQSGIASGVNNAASRLAGLFAVAALGAVAGYLFARIGGPGAVFNAPASDGAAGMADQEGAFRIAYAAAMMLAALWAFAAAAASLRLRPEPAAA
jgi:EmrB/QacA subfamily drug resistance transporter